MRFGINARLIKDRGRVFNPAVIGAVLFALMPMSVSSPLLIILLGAAIGMLLISVFAPEDFNFLFAVFLAGLAIRASLALLFYYLSFVFVGDYSPGFLFQNDGWPYSQQGWAISKFAERGIKVTMDTFMRDPNMRVWGSSGNITSYDFFASHVYGITGYSPVSLFFISGAAGSIACLFVYFIARRLFLSRGIARISACLAFFWPSFIMWSTQNLKEPMIAMFTLMALCAIFYMNGRFFFPFLCLCLGSLYVLSQINFPVFMIVIGSICFSALFLYLSRSMGSKKRALAVIFICGALVFIFLKDYALAVIFKKSSYDITSYKSMFSFFQYHRSVRAYGNLQFFGDFDISNPFKAVLFAPIGFLYAAFAPFPWQLGSVMQIMAVPETIAFYFLFPKTARGIVFAYKNMFGRSVILLTIIVMTLGFLALVEGNSGTLFRHRAVAFYLIFIFTALGISLKKNEN